MRWLKLIVGPRDCVTVAVATTAYFFRPLDLVFDVVPPDALLATLEARDGVADFDLLPLDVADLTLSSALFYGAVRN